MSDVADAVGLNLPGIDGSLFADGRDAF